MKSLYNFILFLFLLFPFVAKAETSNGCLQTGRKLGATWHFPSDHLPVGAKVKDVRILSWNVLNDHFMDWVEKKDSQGLKGSWITELNIPSPNHPNITLRDEKVIEIILQMIADSRYSNKFIFSLQECSGEFARALQKALPHPIGIVLADPLFQDIDQNIVLYNVKSFALITKAFVNAFAHSDPDRPLMDLIFMDKKSKQKWQIINAHLPGDPLKPGIEEFANYVTTHLKKDCLTLAMGDMNFLENELQLGLEKSIKDWPTKPDLINVAGQYPTNIAPYVYLPKNIDHIWLVKDKGLFVDTQSLKPDEVWQGLQESVDLLLSLKGDKQRRASVQPLQ